VPPDQRKKIPRFMAPKEQSQPRPLVQAAQPIQVDDQQITVSSVNLPPQLFIERDLSKDGKQMDKSKLGKNIDFDDI
jgi:hypothetical protein